jgi:tRNA threonylcarbamoyladenosine biosynthesis protein TsaE
MPENLQPSNVRRSSAEALFPVTSQSVEETYAFGAQLAETLGAGAVLALYGDLGTGKTHLVKGIAQGLGLDPAAVRSPTFTILRTYEEGRRPLYHFDAYRVQNPDEFVELGFEEYVHGDGLTCIEWADRVASLLPPHTLHLRLTHVDAQRRRIALHSPEETGDA